MKENKLVEIQRLRRLITELDNRVIEKNSWSPGELEIIKSKLNVARLKLRHLYLSQ